MDFIAKVKPTEKCPYPGRSNSINSNPRVCNEILGTKGESIQKKMTLTDYKTTFILFGAFNIMAWFMFILEIAWKLL